jgi:hypothetical protein
MILRIPFLVILLALFTLTLFSQHLVKGRVLSLPDRQPIPYANIGIMDATIGTISDQDGSFSFRIPAHYMGDSILFSALGYSKISIPALAIIILVR